MARSAALAALAADLDVDTAAGSENDAPSTSGRDHTTDYVVIGSGIGGTLFGVVSTQACMRRTI